MLVTLSGSVTLTSPAQPLNAYLPMLVTLPGIVILVSVVQLQNANISIIVKLVGSSMLVIPVPSKAQTPMLVMLLGSVMLVRIEHPLNEPPPILFTATPLISAGIVASVTDSSQSVIVPVAWSK